MKFTSYSKRALALLAASCVLPVGVGTVSANITIATVPVGNPSNAADISTGFGAVGYDYNIGEYDVTSGQYAAFLNTVAGVDTFSLYNPNMAGGGSYGAYGCGITQTGAGTVINPYSYSVSADFINRPVTWVSFWDATRFANWLDNGQPTGPEGSGTTETGTYTLTNNSIANNTVTRNAGATWAVTSENEWYKAAYYNPNTRSYYLYPTSSNTQPGTNLADPSGNDANYYNGVTFPIDGGYYTTPVGQFANSPSPYGTYDQGGDVWQWNESIYNGFYRGLRGGSFSYTGSYLESNADYSFVYPTNGVSYLGFRVTEIPATVPEPGALALLAVGGIGLAVRRRVRRV